MQLSSPKSIYAPMRLAKIAALASAIRAHGGALLPRSRCLVVSQRLGAGSVAWSGQAGILRAQRPQRDGGQARRRNGGRARQEFTGTFRTETPDRPYDIVLGNPTDTSVTASVLAYSPLEGYIEFGPRQGDYRARSARLRLEPREAERSDSSQSRCGLAVLLPLAKQGRPRGCLRGVGRIHVPHRAGGRRRIRVHRTVRFPLGRADGSASLRGVPAKRPVRRPGLPHRLGRHVHDRPAARGLPGGSAAVSRSKVLLRFDRYGRAGLSRVRQPRWRGAATGARWEHGPANSVAPTLRRPSDGSADQGNYYAWAMGRRALRRPGSFLGDAPRSSRRRLLGAHAWRGAVPLAYQDVAGKPGQVQTSSSFITS